MKDMLTLAALLLAAQAAPPRPARPAPTRPGISWAESDSLEQKLLSFEKRGRNAPPGTVSVTEGEINSYLNLSMAGKLPAGLQNPEFHFDKDRVDLTADVDFDQVRRTLPPTSALNPLSYLGGRLGLTLKGHMETKQEGFGSFEFEQARLGPVSLPTQLLAQSVASFTKTPQNPQGFDILAPFRLPYSLKHVRLQAGHAVLEF
jgi:hypothetical protein